MSKVPVHKLYCYVDETGQDTGGRFFIVVVIIVSSKERDQLIHFLEIIERRSGKKNRKWIKTKGNQSYITSALSRQWLKGKIFYYLTHDTREYDSSIAKAVTRAVTSYITNHRILEYKATIIIDGLKPTECLTMGARLRKRGVRTQKIKGARDESNALIRLADVIAGIVREAKEGNRLYRGIVNTLIADGLLHKL